MKDELEAVLARMVCFGRVTLDAARREIASNWHEAYERSIGSRPWPHVGGQPGARAPAAPIDPSTRPTPDLACPDDKIVWVNCRTHIYHFAGENWFGRTKNGRFMCEREADREGDRPTANRQ